MGMNVTFQNADCYELRDFRFSGWAGLEYVVFDLEATGPVVEADSVTQIGAVRLYGDGTDGAVFESFVRPWKPIPPKIEGLTGITNARVATAPEFAAVWNDFRTFCGDAVLVTQCGYEFDFPLLDRVCDRAGLKRLANVRLDTKAIFALLHPDRAETFSTDFLSDYYGIDHGGFKRHDALGDARLIARIFRAELEEAKSMGTDALETERIRIKRFVLPPL
jgi:DNA polymerase III epsilon subunit family exonuclease